MAVNDVPPNVMQEINAESAAGFVQHMQECRATSTLINEVVNASAAEQFNEMDPAEARAIEKVLALPKIG